MIITYLYIYKFTYCLNLVSPKKQKSNCLKITAESGKFIIHNIIEVEEEYAKNDRV